MTKIATAVKSGISEVLRGRRGEASVAGLFWSVAILLAGTMLTGLKDILPTDLTTSQQAMVVVVAMILLAVILSEAVEPFMILPTLRKTVAIRQLAGLDARSVILHRLGGWILFAVGPVLIVVLGSLSLHVGLSIPSAICAIVLSIAMLVTLVSRRWVRAKRKDWRTISGEPTGADALSEGIDGYGVTVAGGALAGLLIWFIDDSPIPEPLNIVVALAGLVAVVVAVTHYTRGALSDA